MLHLNTLTRQSLWAFTHDDEDDTEHRRLVEYKTDDGDYRTGYLVSVGISPYWAEQRVNIKRGYVVSPDGSWSDYALLSGISLITGGVS